MKKAKIIVFGLLVMCLTAFGANAQQASNIVKKDLSQADIDRIVRKFTENEAAFRNALTSYVFNRSATIQTIGLGGQISGNFRRDSFLSLTPEGLRFEKILFAPIPTLTEITVTPADIDNLSGVDPFAIDPAFVSQYNFTYVGKEKIDELNLYVFDVSPNIALDPKKVKRHYFSGRIWVDDEDLTIVKSKGKAVPEQKNEKFPILETWRENVDGKYWFPSLTTGDDDLVFDNGQVSKIRVRVKYTNYAVGKSTVIIGNDEEEVKDPPPAPSPPPKKP
ncbi:MAG: outer membrane lipoprotein-sorting protein [Acidobacteriota bacterium]|nr:outer membrane lipoprotein-sorting protein [Acidobacteriota bacterium]